MSEDETLNYTEDDYSAEKHPDLEPVPKGDYLLRIEGVEGKKVTKVDSVRFNSDLGEGQRFLSIRLSVQESATPEVDLSHAGDVYHNVWLPNSAICRDKKTDSGDRRRFRHFIEAFNVVVAGDINPNVEWIGAEAWCNLVIETDEEYGDKNRLTRVNRPAKGAGKSTGKGKKAIL